MQSTTTTNLFHKNGIKPCSSSSAFPKNLETPFIILPRQKFEKIVDFLEDKWETKVSRRNNAFFLEDKQEHPIAWLNNQDSITLVLVDKTSGRKNSFHVRIDDIQLPTPIRIDHRIYRNLLYQLVRTSGGGIVRWFNKFYETATGRVKAELVSQEKILIFESEGLFRTSKIVDLNTCAAMQVSREQYFHLLDFLTQESGEEIIRIGNGFYPWKAREFLDSIVKSAGTVSKSTLKELGTALLAELVSNDTIRLPDGTIKKISNLALTRRVHRNHLYFCSSCQSFVRTSYRTSTHQSQSGNHSITYVSSSITLVPIYKARTPKKASKKFPEILYKFWGFEKGKVPKEKTRRRDGMEKQSPITVEIPIAGKTKLAEPRAVSTTMLLLTADIAVDGHQVTREERVLAFRRLEVEESPPNPETEHQLTANMRGEVCVGEDTPVSKRCKESSSQDTDELPELIAEA
jgi:hypothetical protein